MAVKIQWQPPLVLEERKKAQWEKIIRYELGEISDAAGRQPPLRGREPALEGGRLGAHQASGATTAAQTRGRVVQALRAAGKPVA